MLYVQGYTRRHWSPLSGNYSLIIALAATRATANKTMMEKGHFDGCGGAPVQYRLHCLMEEIYCFPRSHWVPPSSKYLLR
jgi:hypothetical protein